MIRVEVNNFQRKYTVGNESILVDLISQALKVCGLNSMVTKEASIVFNLVNSPRMSQVNRDFLNHVGTTDVITFSYLDELTDGLEPEPVVAEIFICLDVAKKAAKKFKTSFTQEVILYIVHGILHVCGYDDHEQEDIVAMRAAEKTVLKKLKDIDKLHIN
ncbi:MAG: rRNA maturation RNase YbeY [Lentisphaeria bacterium]|nr:rRNA maturation RNase YbeY [Lentisphaeria bacterium]